MVVKERDAETKGESENWDMKWGHAKGLTCAAAGFAVEEGTKNRGMHKPLVFGKGKETASSLKPAERNVALSTP